MEEIETPSQAGESMIRPAELFWHAWKVYAAMIAWPVYLFFLPAVYAKAGGWVFAFVLFPGVYLYTWMACLAHECWHKLIPGVPHRLCFRILSWEMISDPQLYELTHGLHHAHVHTYEDLQLHPSGPIHNRYRRAAYNILEIVFGDIFLRIMRAIRLIRDPEQRQKFHVQQLVVSVFIWIAFLGTLLYFSHLRFRVAGLIILGLYALSIWLGSVVYHHGLLIEHGKVFVDGSIEKRNLASRNLMTYGIPEYIWLFFDHHDTLEHVLHHTQPESHARLFPRRIPLPEGAVHIGLRGYLDILRDMILGRETIHVEGHVGEPIKGD